jgi:predicted permease
METLVITTIATVAALFAGWWGSLLLRDLVMPETEFGDASLHVRVVMFTMAIALLAGLASGVVPALRASKASLTTAMKEGGSRLSSNRSWLGRGLVVAQAALSVVLLVGAGLFVRSLANVQDLRIGFDADRLVFASIRSDRTDRSWPIHVAARLREITARLESMPGIEAVGRAQHQPMMGYFRRRFWVGADSAESFGERALKMHLVASAFFRAAGMRIERGRTFTGSDGGGSSSEVVVNDAAARLLWPNRDAIGQCIRVYTSDAPCRIVVGVVENARVFNIMEPEVSAQLYMPVQDTVPGRGGTTLIVRTGPGGTSVAAAELHTTLREAFPAGQPEVLAMTEFLEPQYRPWRLGATLFAGFGLLALIVAMVGIFSTISYGVSQRTHEFGVRIALGARIGNVVRQVLGEGLRTVAVGVLVGIALALVAAKLVSTLLYGVTPSDPAVLVLVAIALMAAAALAAALPAWRAARVDPVSALRME